MVRATSASYPGGATGSWTNSPYLRRRVTVAMDGSELLVAMTGSRPKWVMAGSWLSVRTQMDSAGEWAAGVNIEQAWLPAIMWGQGP